MYLTVWKFPFPVTDRPVVNLPAGARVLHVDCQGGMPTLWALVDPRAKAAPRAFRLFGTGHPIACGEAEDGSPDLSHVATFQHGEFVWHVFE